MTAFTKDDPRCADVLARLGKDMTLRALSRRLWPTWSRRQRARWVLAKAKAQGLKVAVSSHWPHDASAYRFARRMP